MYEEVFSASALRDGSRGLRVAALETCSRSGADRREKDRVEAAVIRSALRDGG